MFTFGREHEQCAAIARVTDPEEQAFIRLLIDAIHDLIEGRVGVPTVRALLQRGISEGRGGTWEQSGVWLRKLGPEHPELLDLWSQLASHRSAQVRFRIAAFLSDMPPQLALRLGTLLLADRSAKVRGKAGSDLALVPISGVMELLRASAAKEADEGALANLQWAIEERGAKIREEHAKGV